MGWNQMFPPSPSTRSLAKYLARRRALNSRTWALAGLAIRLLRSWERIAESVDLVSFKAGLEQVELGVFKYFFDWEDVTAASGSSRSVE